MPPGRARVSFAPSPATTMEARRRLPVADDAWGNEYVDPTPAAGPSAPAVAPKPLPPPPPPPPPPPRPPLASKTTASFPTLRGLCLTALAQHTFLLADAAMQGDDPSVLRRALPSPDDRLSLASAARRRGELGAALFLALADASWPVLCVDATSPPPQAVVKAARAGLLRGVRNVDWVLPSEAAAPAAAAPGGPSPAAASAGPPILLPSEAAAVVKALAAHCPNLESLSLRRADPERRARPAVVAAVARAVLAAALPKALGASSSSPAPLALATASASGRQGGREEEEEEGEGEENAQESPALESWEDALADEGEGEGGDGDRDGNRGSADALAAAAAAAATASAAAEARAAAIEARATFAPSLSVLRWQDLPQATADAIAARAPRIALDVRGGAGAEAAAKASAAPRQQQQQQQQLDAPWMAAFAPGWDDTGAERAERREEERRQREAARARKLLLVQRSEEGDGDGGGGGPSDDDDDDDGRCGRDDGAAARDAGRSRRAPPGATTAADADARQAPEEEEREEAEQGDSVAARFKRAYAERAARLEQVARAREERRRRRAVRASPGLSLVERWLDEPV